MIMGLVLPTSGPHPGARPYRSRRRAMPCGDG
jgi:hypothetical protein